MSNNYPYINPQGTFTSSGTQGTFTSSSIVNNNVITSPVITANSASTIYGTYNSVSNIPIAAYSNQGKEIVRLEKDGQVKWAADINVDEAAEAFARSIALGAEMVAGINQRVKIEIKNQVFEEIISIAQEKGSLTAEDLTYLLRASKIVEKLKSV